MPAGFAILLGASPVVDFTGHPLLDRLARPHQRAFPNSRCIFAEPTHFPFFLHSLKQFAGVQIQEDLFNDVLRANPG